jgi:hypothetical protein
MGLPAAYAAYQPNVIGEWDGGEPVKRRTGATGWIAIAGLVLVGLTSGCLSMMVSEDAPGAASPVVATAATAVAEVEAATQVAPTLAETVAGQTPAGGR